MSDQGFSEYHKLPQQHRGCLDPGTTVYDYRGNPFSIPHAWEIYAQRNLSGQVMFVHDNNPYYVYDCDVYWFEER